MKTVEKISYYQTNDIFTGTEMEKNEKEKPSAKIKTKNRKRT